MISEMGYANALRRMHVPNFVIFEINVSRTRFSPDFVVPGVGIVLALHAAHAFCRISWYLTSIL